VLALLPDSLDSLDSLVRVEKEVVCSGCANWLFGAFVFSQNAFGRCWRSSRTAWTAWTAWSGLKKKWFVLVVLIGSLVQVLMVRCISLDFLFSQNAFGRCWRSSRTAWTAWTAWSGLKKKWFVLVVLIGSLVQVLMVRCISLDFLFSQNAFGRCWRSSRTAWIRCAAAASSRRIWW
jgi:hypothetical protein